MNTIISKWRGLFKENTGVDVSREACFEYITAFNRDGIEQFNKKHFANSVSGEAWAKLRLSQILTRIHRVEMGPNTKLYSPPNEHIAQLTYEQLVRVVDEGFLQALTWHPMSEDVVSEYSAFLEMVDDVQWGKEISTLSAHIKAVDNKNKSE